MSKLSLAFKSWLDAYKKSICASIKKQLEKVNKADDNKDKVNNILNAAVNISTSTSLEDELTQLLIEVYIDGVDESIGSFDLNMNIDSTDDIFQTAAKEYAEQRTADLVTKLDDATKNMLKTDLDNYMRQGLTPQEIANKIANDYAFSDIRALCIARTETGFAWNNAGIETARQGGATGVRVFDGDHDKDCVEADGQTWSFAYAEAHLLQHPNCVRSFSPTMDDELDKTNGDE